ncbi:hypothetical protein A2U01_0074892 [Trifolium medium]|uniref:Uncharacterized protein n=1 Tax=Trifolium medium TaxID=97028 RepID=A0A392SZZ5_9FABA|nr:hypothetical protein [Trifolium medium]
MQQETRLDPELPHGGLNFCRSKGGLQVIYHTVGNPIFDHIHNSLKMGRIGR